MERKLIFSSKYVKYEEERTYINRIEKWETDMQLSSFIQIVEALCISLILDASIA